MKFHLRCALAAAAMTLVLAPAAQAQSFWSSMPELNSLEDKVVVHFPRKYAKGNIVVSFGDRRLYHVISRGRAISYPIAIPRKEARWQGDTILDANSIDAA